MFFRYIYTVDYIRYYSHRETVMDKTTFSITRRVSQFLSKLFYHFQPHMNSKLNQKKLTLSNKKKRSKFSCKTSTLERYYVRSQYPPLYRTCCLRERTSTLTSIQEE